MGQEYTDEEGENATKMAHSGENSKVIRTFERPYDGTMVTFTPLSSGNAFKLTVGAT